MVRYDDVLEFWLGDLDADGVADASMSQRWYRKDPDLDATIRERFQSTHTAIVAREREAWLDEPRGRVAYVIVLDQLSRNMFRDSPDMYAADRQALEAAAAGIGLGVDRALKFDERNFLYMPFMHAESAVAQRRCIELFAQLAEEATGRGRERAQASVRYAKMHADIVERFGRFPHRNVILDRTTTDEEEKFLLEPGSSF